jgi:anti-sigma regulatory factor (Ser/Thr protein kinase)
VTAPDRVETDLRPEPSSAREGRQFTRDALTEWGFTTLVDTALLVVSELVTNAIRYGRPPIQLVLTRVLQTVRIDVHDGRTGSVDFDRDAGISVESGRGLAIVQALATDTGVDDLPGDRKVVHATLALTA